MATDFSGEWLSIYSYHDGDDNSQHIVTFEDDAELNGQSKAQPDGSELSLQLAYDAVTSTLTGTWRETTSPTGAYKGRVFHGALQLILNQAGDTAEGTWVGVNSSLTRINTGNWSLQRQNS